MTKKTGLKANYIYHKINGQQEVEVKEIVNGYEMGVVYSERHRSHYTMIPKALAGEDAKRSKQEWLRGDKGNAVSKFYALIAKLKGQTNVISVEKYDTQERYEVQSAGKVNIPADPKFRKERLVLAGGRFKEGEGGEVELFRKVPFVDVPESYCIEWLKRELQNPHRLAKKTGVEAFNYFRDWMLKEQITLKELYTNYTNSIKYSKIQDNDTKKKTKKAWDVFVNLIKRTTVESVTIKNVKAFEKYLHNKGLADKTIYHYKNHVTKIFRYNCEKVYVGNSEIKQVLEYFNSWEDLDVNSDDSVSAQIVEYNDFINLYNAADKKNDLQLKAVLMLCLNTATYIREVARFKISDINLNEQTLMTRRNKTGRCKKFAFLWDRTVKDLQTYLDTRKDDSDVLFVSSHGTAYINGEGLRTRLYQLRKKCGLLRVEFQHLRDTFQTLANEVGVTQYHSNMVMGHSVGEKTGVRYSHRRVHNELKEACLKVEKSFFG